MNISPLFSAISEAFDYGVWAADAQGYLVYVSPSFLNLCGARQEDLVGLNWVKRLHPENPDEALHHWLECIRVGCLWESYYRIKAPDGRVHNILSRARAVRDATGEITGWAGLNLDVTDYERVRGALRRSQKWFQELANFVPQIIWTANSEGAVSYFNKRWYEFSGLRPQQSLGFAWTQAIHPEDYSRACESWSQARDLEQFLEVRLRLRRHDGEYRWMLVRAQPVRDPEGLVAWFASTTDIEDQMRTEQDLRAAKEYAESLTAAKSEFLASMSHEIRTPLTSILGFAELLQEKAPPDIQEWAELICDAGRRLMETLNSVLDLARLEGGQMALELAPLDLVAQAREIALLFQSQANQKGLRIVEEYGGNNIRVDADPAAINRVLFNVVGNAIKFTESGTVCLRIRKGEHRAHIEVQDSGPGMSHAFLEQLFQPFRQEVGLGKRGGSGLGLAITRQLVDLMNGTILARSEKGVGSTFTISLPLSQVSPPKPILKMPDSNTPEPSETREPRLNILIVEDDPNTSRIASIFLQKVHDVATAASIEEALNAARSRRFDVVLLDINIRQRLSGVGLLHQIREIPGYQTVPVIAFTAHVLPGEREEFTRHGFDEYLAKPFSKKELFDVIHRVTRHGPSAAA